VQTTKIEPSEMVQDSLSASENHHFDEINNSNINDEYGQEMSPIK